MKDKRWLTVLFSGLMIFTLGCDSFAKLFQDKQTVSTVAPTLPAPPTPASEIKGTPEAQAIYFADLLRSPQTRLAGWLGLYDFLDVPVLGQDGATLGSTGEDPIGPRFWQVWYTSELDRPGRGITLSDAGRLLAVGLPQLDGPALGPVLLNDLRLAVKSEDPQVRLLGAVVRQRILRGASRADVLDPAVTSDKAVIDLPTLHLLAWIMMRGALIQSANDIAGAYQQPNSGYRFASFALTDRPVPTTTPCSESLGDPDVTYWVNWALENVVGPGIPIPGMAKAIPGLIERVQNFVGAGKDMIGKTGRGLAWLNAITSAITLAMQLAALEIAAVQEPDPLVRTKGTNHGKEGKIIFRLSSRPKKPADGTEAHRDGNSLDNCFLSYVTNALGLNFSFPPAGLIAGAELEFQGGAGFPDLVLFGNYKDLLGKDTDANGQAAVAVTGTAQKKQVPETAKKVDKEFSIIVTGQPEPYNGNSVANVFFSGITFGAAPNAPAGISAIVDILKTVHWNLGEHVFRLTDWEPQGYRATGQLTPPGEGTFSGVICSLEKPFTVNSANALVKYTHEYVPSSATSGTSSYTGGGRGIGVTGEGSGTYKVEGADTDKPRIVDSTMGSGEMCVQGRCVQAQGGGVLYIDLIPLDTDECQAN